MTTNPDTLVRLDVKAEFDEEVVKKIDSYSASFSFPLSVRSLQTSDGLLDYTVQTNGNWTFTKKEQFDLVERALKYMHEQVVWARKQFDEKEEEEEEEDGKPCRFCGKVH